VEELVDFAEKLANQTPGDPPVNLERVMAGEGERVNAVRLLREAVRIGDDPARIALKGVLRQRFLNAETAKREMGLTKEHMAVLDSTPFLRPRRVQGTRFYDPALKNWFYTTPKGFLSIGKALIEANRPYQGTSMRVAPLDLYEFAVMEPKLLTDRINDGKVCFPYYSLMKLFELRPLPEFKGVVKGFDQYWMDELLLYDGVLGETYFFKDPRNPRMSKKGSMQAHSSRFFVEQYMRTQRQSEVFKRSYKKYGLPSEAYMPTLFEMIDEDIVRQVRRLIPERSTILVLYDLMAAGAVVEDRLGNLMIDPSKAYELTADGVYAPIKDRLTKLKDG